MDNYFKKKHLYNSTCRKIAIEKLVLAKQSNIKMHCNTRKIIP